MGVIKGDNNFSTKDLVGGVGEVCGQGGFGGVSELLGCRRTSRST